MKIKYLLFALGTVGLAGCPGDQPEPEHQTSIPKQAIDRGQEVALESNLSQIRQYIAMYKSDNEGRVPASMEELQKGSKFPREMFTNPVDGKPLTYDAATGTIDVLGKAPMTKRSRASTLNNSDPTSPSAIAAPAVPAQPAAPAAPADGEPQ